VFAVDTNIFVYAHFDRYPQHDKARRFCEEQLFGGADWCMGWQVFYEYLRITTHPRVHDRPLTIRDAVEDMVPYMGMDNCQLLVHTPRHQQVIIAMTAEAPSIAGNLVHDCHYAALLVEHGVKTIYTADTDFKKFGLLRTIDPTT